jgi:uncharacterized protein (TIGR03437 family)
MTYPLSSIGAVSVVAGPSATAAGKTLRCVSNSGWLDCALYGVNTLAMSSGVAATATFTALPSLSSASAALGLTNLKVVDTGANTVPSTGTGGSITIVSQPLPTWSISGLIPQRGGVLVTLGGAAVKTTLTDTAGAFAFAGLANGNYTVTPTLAGLTPTSRAVTVNGANVGSVNFTPAPQSWTVSGTITQGAGALVTLAGAASRTATADASGNYAFTALANGSYTITPAKPGLVLTPASRAVNVNGADVGAVSFSAAQGSWTISGNVLNTGTTTLTLGGAASRTTTTNETGGYSFSNLPAGSYTVTPSRTGTTFTPTARVVALGGADQLAINFTGTAQGPAGPQIDSTVWSDSTRPSNILASPAFSTRQSNELLLAFVSTDSSGGVNVARNPSGGGEVVRAVSGGALTWTLVKRTNAQGGTAEIWRAFATQRLSGVNVSATLSRNLTGSITIMSFSGVDATGVNGSKAIGAAGNGHASRGAPTASLIPMSASSLVLAVGNDPVAAVGRSPGSGQSLVHEFVESSRGTYWVQRLNSPITIPGAMVTVNDPAPTSSPYNYTVVEVRGPGPLSRQMTSSAAGARGSSVNAETAGRSPRPSSRPGAGQIALINPVTGKPQDACSPRGWAAVSGANFTSLATESAQSVPLPTKLAGTRVEVNGEAVPLLLASAEQVNFQCPGLPAGTPLSVRVVTEAGEILSAPDSLMSAAAPAVFMFQGTTRAVTQVVAATPTGSADPQSSDRSAQPGDHVRIYASGLGTVNLHLAPGEAAPMDRLAVLDNRATILLGGLELKPAFAGLAPGTVGVFQIDLQIPPHAAIGPEIPLSIRLELADGTELLSNLASLAISATKSDTPVAGY